MTRSRLVLRLEHVAFAILACALGACASIIGIEDRSLDPESGDASLAGDGIEADQGVADGSNDRTTVSDVMTVDSRPPEGGTPPVDGGGGPDVGKDVTTSADAGMDATGDAFAGDAGLDAPSVDAPGPEASTCLDPCPLATGLNNAWGLASDGTNVYWTEFGDDTGSVNGSVKSCPVGGCPATGPVPMALAQLNPRGMVVDGQNVYWGTASYGAVNGGIWSCPVNVAHCSPMQLAVADVPFGLAIDASYIYWTDYDDSTVHRVLKGGGTDNVLYDGGGAAFLLNQAVVDNAFVYFTDANSTVFSLPLSGGNPVVLGAGAFGGDWPVAQDTAFVYYGIEGAVQRTAKGSLDGGVPLATATDPVGLSIDPATGMVYWLDWGSGGGDDGTLGKVSPDGGGRAVLAASLVYPFAVAVNGPYVFWVSQGMPDPTGMTILPSTGVLYRQAK